MRLCMYVLARQGKSDHYRRIQPPGFRNDGQERPSIDERRQTYTTASRGAQCAAGTVGKKGREEIPGILPLATPGWLVGWLVGYFESNPRCTSLIALHPHAVGHPPHAQLDSQLTAMSVQSQKAVADMG